MAVVAAVVAATFGFAPAVPIAAAAACVAVALWTVERTRSLGAGCAAAVVAIAVIGLAERATGGLLDARLSGTSVRLLTSVALAFVGTALYCAATGRHRASRVLALAPLTYAATVLTAGFGSFEDADVAARAAIVSLPHSALALLFGSLGLALWSGRDDSRLRTSVVWTCGVMSALIGLTALFGHAFDVATVRDWYGASTSWLAAFGHCALGLGLVSVLPALERRRNWAPVALGIVAIALGVTAWQLLLPREEARVAAATRTVLDLAAHQMAHA
ncbi:MAG TPA: hypothetical protein VJ724_12115, partial [Tahibacter sp.]|nr:hypothetical protein [Tahibacter sp.]